jgi:beta-glucosidase/6-phospho-beta-glucosidase/beta-galactosidase
MLKQLWDRYRRPILISETGAEGEAGVGWFGYICAEVRQAQREGVEVQGICLYPVMDYLGWDDDRHCRCGLIALSDDLEQRALRADLAEEIRVQQQLFQAAAHRQPALSR